MIKWIDRNLWSVPVAFFILAVSGFTIAQVECGHPLLLSSAQAAARQSLYSSLAGTSSSLLGFVIAAVAVLAAFTPREVESSRGRMQEKLLAKARTQLITALLSTSFFLLMVLITSSLALVVDLHKVGNPTLTTIILGSVISSVVGLTIGGLGLALAIIEYSRREPNS